MHGSNWVFLRGFFGLSGSVENSMSFFRLFAWILGCGQYLPI